MFFKSPVFEISTDEAKKLAHATKNVLALHNLALSPSTLAYLQLIGVCLAIYGPRFAMYMAHMKAVKAQQQRAAQQAAMPEATAQSMGQPMPNFTSTVQ